VITFIYALMAAGMLAAALVAGVRRLWLLAVIAVALFWDNAIIAAGSTIGTGDLLIGLSVPRYVAHAVLTPLLILVVFGIAALRRRPWVWVLTGLLIAAGVYFEIIRLHLEPRTYADTLRYVNTAGMPLPAIMTDLVLIGIGVILWRRDKLPWLFLGAVAMFVAAGAGFNAPWLGNLGELVLIGAILLTAAKRKRVA
jgi:hypothetical protein